MKPMLTFNVRRDTWQCDPTNYQPRRRLDLRWPRQCVAVQARNHLMSKAKGPRTLRIFSASSASGNSTQATTTSYLSGTNARRDLAGKWLRLPCSRKRFVHPVAPSCKRVKKYTSQMMIVSVEGLSTLQFVYLLLPINTWLPRSSTCQVVSSEASLLGPRTTGWRYLWL